MAIATVVGPIRRRIYGVESNNDCDVAFIASDKWRLPAHSEILKESNVVFRSMFSQDFSYPQEEGTGLLRVDVDDVDGRALDNLLRCLYGYPVPVQSIETALLTLYAAHKYQCPELVNLCISYLTFHLKDSNVLTVLKFAKLLAVDYQNLQNVQVEKRIEKPRRRPGRAKSRSRGRRPPETKVKRRPFDGQSGHDSRTVPVVDEDVTATAPLLISDLDTIETACSDLLQTCLVLVDQNALKILESDELEELDLETLTLILSRDTLNVQDEVKVFEATQRWAEQQCKQLQLPLTNGSKRKVLKDSLFLPRYLTMTLKTWQNGPLKSGIFAPEEVDIIERLITGKANLSQVTSPDAPLFLSSRFPRCPVTQLNLTATKAARGAGMEPRRRRFSILFRLLKFQNVKCCKKGGGSEASSPSSSYPGTPVHECYDQEIPNPNPPPHRRESQTARINFVEQMIVCFACLFD